jgi:uncharacterized protein (DUF2225 family)
MTKAREVEVTCPCCGATFDAPMLMSTNTLGGRTTDFHSIAVGFDPIVFMVATCPKCGYTDYSDRLIDGKSSANDDIKRRVYDELTPHVPQGRIPAALSYIFLARIAQWNDESPLKIGDLYLRAAWCNQEDEHRNAEVSNRLAAVAYYKRWLEQTQIRDDQYFITMYLVGELYRRVGQVTDAHEWFDRLLESVGLQPNQNIRRLAALAFQQRNDPKEMM